MARDDAVDAETTGGRPRERDRADGDEERTCAESASPGVAHKFQDTTRRSVAVRQLHVGRRHRHRQVERLASAFVERELAKVRNPAAYKEVPTFAEWFKGRFWREWVVGRRNKPTEVKSKDFHL